MRTKESADYLDCWNDRYIGAKLLIWWARTSLENQALDKDTYLKADEDTHCPLKQSLLSPVNQQVNESACNSCADCIQNLLL